MIELSDKDFKELEFDTSKEPFVSKNGRTIVYKNYVRDGSGDYEGYLVEHPIIKEVHTKEELLDFLIGI